MSVLHCVQALVLRGDLHGPTLRRSLSHTLAAYPVLAGRWAGDSRRNGPWVVACTNHPLP